MTVGEVVSHRFGELRRLGLAKRKAPGRLLAYFPDAELFDGAAQAASDGLFDVHSAPAWGTWVGYFEESADSDSVYVRYLLAWISQGLVKRATIGIEVDCTASIQWVDDTSLEIKSILRHIDSANAA
jgi:hypothetical protein